MNESRRSYEPHNMSYLFIIKIKFVASYLNYVICELPSSVSSVDLG